MSGDVFGYINLCTMKCLIGRRVIRLRSNCRLDRLRVVVVALALSTSAAEEEDSDTSDSASVEESSDEVEDDVESSIDLKKA